MSSSRIKILLIRFTLRRTIVLYVCELSDQKEIVCMDQTSIIEFENRMTTLKNNPSRYHDIRFTRYFGGICICYFDFAEKKYVVERIVKEEEDVDDSKSSELLDSSRTEEK